MPYYKREDVRSGRPHRHTSEPSRNESRSFSSQKARKAPDPPKLKVSLKHVEDLETITYERKRFETTNRTVEERRTFESWTERSSHPQHYSHLPSNSKSHGLVSGMQYSDTRSTNWKDRHGNLRNGTNNEPQSSNQNGKPKSNYRFFQSEDGRISPALTSSSETSSVYRTAASQFSDHESDGARKLSNNRLQSSTAHSNGNKPNQRSFAETQTMSRPTQKPNGDTKALNVEYERLRQLFGQYEGLLSTLNNNNDSLQEVQMNLISQFHRLNNLWNPTSQEFKKQPEKMERSTTQKFTLNTPMNVQSNNQVSRCNTPANQEPVQRSETPTLPKEVQPNLDDRSETPDSLKTTDITLTDIRNIHSPDPVNRAITITNTRQQFDENTNDDISFIQSVVNQMDENFKQPSDFNRHAYVGEYRTLRSPSSTNNVETISPFKEEAKQTNEINSPTKRQSSIERPNEVPPAPPLPNFSGSKVSSSPTNIKVNNNHFKTSQEITFLKTSVKPNEATDAPVGWDEVMRDIRTKVKRYDN
ncbi:hypothetical protein M3Y98_00308100 [Aphelenchoides besseyi]|nr:hypothetical protein M3Y98_00308100 [Aphelenchoides besseyi]